MIDRTYVEATRGPAILGPATCATCGAWVEYAGGAWVAPATDVLHECEPFLPEAEHKPATVLTMRLGSAMPPHRQAHPLPPEPEPEPVWVGRLGVVIVAVAIVAMLASIVAIALR